MQCPRESVDISEKPRACPCYNIYVTLPNLSCQMCSACDDIVSKSLIVKKRGAISIEKLADNFCLQLLGWFPCVNCHDFDLQPLQPVQLPTKLSSTKDMLRLKSKAQESLEKLVRNLILKVKILKMHWLLNGFNSIAMLMSCRNLRKVIVLRTQLKAMSGHLEFSTLGEWQGMSSMALMTSVQKMCLTITAKPATDYASLCVKLEGLMNKNTHH